MRKNFNENSVDHIIGAIQAFKAQTLAQVNTPSRIPNGGASAGRHAWVQVVRGELKLNGHALWAGDGAALSEEPLLRFEPAKESEVLVFDLA
jgi:redox-sensitive bicupin YhaK (pirin superfamily)